MKASLRWPSIRSKRGFKASWLVAGVAVLVAFGSVALYLASRPPGEDSAEAGFARDMVDHHAQAVQMAEIVRDKTESEEIRILATDIALTQQGQIGQMLGWLAVWDLQATGAKPPMTWMGHPVTEGRMPGMASPEEIDALYKASPEEADELFLRLMIPHHEAAIPMSEAVLEETNRPEVERLASAIAASQKHEIATMQDLLREGAGASAEAEAHGEAHSHESHSHESQSDEASLDLRQLAAGLAHGAAQGAAVFLAGLAVFVALVWLPATRIVRAGQDGTEVFVRAVWALFGLLVVAGAVELSLYATQASGEPLSLGLFGQALSETRVGDVWLARLGLGLLLVAAATWAAQPRRLVFWWVAAGTGGVMLVTLTQLSHAAAEGSSLPFLADWLHVVAASIWMGGLLGFAMALLGPLRAIPAKQQRIKLRRRAVRRFSKVAMLAVMVLALTGLYAILLHVPGPSALIGTPYGLALLAKLGLLALLLVVGGANLVLEGRGPFGRRVGLELALAFGIFVATGFLTSLPPAG